MLAIFFIAYFFGAIPWGFIIGKANKIDIREHGSKNIGSTNVTRVVGSKWGKLCFLLDFLKGFLPSFLTIFILPKYIVLSSSSADICIILAVVGSFMGHIFPIYLKFKGGKGVATGAGALLALSPLAVLIGLIFWVLIFKISRYVSLASILAAVIVSIATTVLSQTGVYPISATLQIFVALVSLIAIIKHKSNIIRLLNGTENRFEKK
ncbi:MAG TPA: acyl-phosphate glycerol 3-phosphate acyltransferase [Lentisphaeria bacterium]|nr:acyl-phosphate glycerol 3-phosphate acyltransferase [Lentisphaeria bacterium]